MEEDDQTLNLIMRLDTNSSQEQENVWTEIKQLKIDIPYYFLLAYPKFKKWKGRLHLLFYCVKYSRINENAFKLGLEGLKDKATLVRYRAASVLAYSLRKEAIPYLEKNLDHKDLETRKDCERAIKAIQQNNHHLFMEGRVHKWIVNEVDDN